MKKKSGCQQCPEQQEKKINATNEDSEVEKDVRRVGVRVGVEGVRRSRKDGGVIESGLYVCIKAAKPKEINKERRRMSTTATRGHIHPTTAITASHNHALAATRTLILLHRVRLRLLSSSAINNHFRTCRRVMRKWRRRRRRRTPEG